MLKTCKFLAYFSMLRRCQKGVRKSFRSTVCGQKMLKKTCMFLAYFSMTELIKKVFGNHLAQRMRLKNAKNIYVLAYLSMQRIY